MNALPTPPKADVPAATPSPLAGLSSAEAVRRLRTDGPNELGVNQRRSLRHIVGEVVREPMFLLLLGAASIYLTMGDAHEAGALMGFVLVIIALTVMQERRTDNALEALRDLASPKATALRDGQRVQIAGREVVRGDVLVLTEGDRVPADGVVLQCHELATDESMLTGESIAVDKAAHATDGSLERVFAGSMVVRGQALMRTEAVGAHTEMGRIGLSLNRIAMPSSPLRQEVGRLTQRLVVIGMALSLGLMALFWWLRGGWLEGLLAGITLAMSLLPQEFPVIMIVFMAMGARRLAAHQVLTRRLDAIETLGETTVLCVDKTGTLTRNHMAVAAWSLPGASQSPETLLQWAVLASETQAHDPMEQAFHQWVKDQGLPASRHHDARWSLAREYELSPQLLAMSHVWRHDDPAHTHDDVACKGAPEAVADLCHLSPAQRDEVSEQQARMADQGLRVLGVARARHDARQPWPSSQHDFAYEWLGLIGLADPLRPEVPEAMAQCHRAGIRVVMITGDHPRTALAIARQAGIETDGVVTGQDMATLNAATLAQRLGRVNVFARVKPDQKLALIEALKARGEVVAMTGDGVNDAPALKAAHIGVAMGLRGTDVAREAAALVLMRDDFTAIVRAVALGRRVFANLRQALGYTLAVHLPIVGLTLLPVLTGLPLLLTPIHIAFLELVIDPTCSMVFEAEPDRADLMRQPPRRTREPALSWRHVALAMLQGGLITLATWVFHRWALAQPWPQGTARTATFLLLVVANIALIFPNRSAHTGWRALWTHTTPVGAAVALGTLVALLAVVAVPALAGLFGFVALPLPLWLGVGLLGLALVLPLQLLKQALAAG